MSQRNDDLGADAPAVLAELQAKDEIRHVLNVYCRAADRLDWDILRACFHEDGFDDHGTYKGSVDGLIERAKTVMPRWESSHHNLGTMTIELDGDVAHTETYFMSTALSIPVENEPQVVCSHFGRYVDRFERRGGQWKIARRVVVSDSRDFHHRIDGREVLENVGIDADAFVKGRRDREDAVYRHVHD